MLERPIPEWFELLPQIADADAAPSVTFEPRMFWIAAPA